MNAIYCVDPQKFITSVYDTSAISTITSTTATNTIDTTMLNSKIGDTQDEYALYNDKDIDTISYTSNSDTSSADEFTKMQFDHISDDELSSSIM